MEAKAPCELQQRKNYNCTSLASVRRKNQKRETQDMQNSKRNDTFIILPWCDPFFSTLLAET